MKVQTLRRPTVLAVDDHDHNLVALEAVLGSDYKLLTAGSGTKALDIIKTKGDEIDVILMDVQMPGFDGFQTAAEIKKLPQAQEIPIIFVTAIFKEDPFVKRGYEVGGVDYFSKPFDPEILKQKVGIYASVRHRSELLKLRERQVEEAEKLLEVGRKLSSVLESLSIGIVIADVNGRICQTNDQVHKICGIDNPSESSEFSKLIGWWDPKGRLVDTESPLAKAIFLGKTSHNATINIHSESDEHKVLYCSASPLLGLDRRIVGAVVALQDVTESKKIEAVLEKQIVSVVQASAAH